jgi:hypothetical protein
MSHDNIAARLTCPACKVQSSDAHPLFQVWWTLTPEALTYRPGDRVYTASPERWGYYKLRDCDPFVQLRVVDTWQCRSCDNLWNWAVTTLEDDGELIVSVEAAELATALRSADYVTDQLRHAYPQIRDPEHPAEVAPGWLERLLRLLDAGEPPAC